MIILKVRGMIFLTSKLSYKEFQKKYFRMFKGSSVKEFANAWKDYKNDSFSFPKEIKGSVEVSDDVSITKNDDVEKGGEKDIKDSERARDVETVDSSSQAVEIESQNSLSVNLDDEAFKEVFNAEKKESVEMSGSVGKDSLPKPVGDSSGGNNEMYYLMVEGFHNTLAGLLHFSSKGKVSIVEDQIKGLNQAGVHLVKKYDDKGLLEEFAPEITYGLALLGVLGQLLVKRPENNDVGVTNA